MKSSLESATRSRPYWLYGLLVAVLLYIGITRLLPGPKQALLRRGHASFLVASISKALHTYADEHEGAYPLDLDALFASRADGSSYFGDRKVSRTDPWDHPFLYEPPTTAHSQPRVVSYGADGKPGGTGEDADIDSDSLAHDR